MATNTTQPTPAAAHTGSRLLWSGILFVMGLAGFVLFSNLPSLLPVQAQPDFADEAMYQEWERVDRPVAEDNLGPLPRSWTWGPHPLSDGLQEPFTESPGGTRLVQYFDKGRMEITLPGEPVSYGLLVNEMIQGRIQIGADAFEEREAPEIALVGDPIEHNANAPTYRSLQAVVLPLNRDRPPGRGGQVVISMLDREGNVVDNPDLAQYDIIYDAYEEDTGHNLPNVFSNYLSWYGMVYENGVYTWEKVFEWEKLVGLPISEPYWTRVKVGTVEKDVLFQVFQRRILTYSPSEDVYSQLAMSNVGQHYLEWRYGVQPGEQPDPQATPQPVGDATETPALPEASPEPTLTPDAPVVTPTRQPRPQPSNIPDLPTFP
ncbi:MAG: hypothetical protein HC837_06895 [Chloroflexaceae bacterium]|nr:hypothetical protein [Chloroflexaceae bacterium]